MRGIVTHSHRDHVPAMFLLATAAVPKPAVRSAFKRASVVAVQATPLPMSEKQLGFCVEHEPNML